MTPEESAQLGLIETVVKDCPGLPDWALKKLDWVVAFARRLDGDLRRAHSMPSAVIREGQDWIELTADRDRWKARAEAGQRFKDFVHAYLTNPGGVPEGDPDNPHQKEGCRIGARLDLLFAERDRLAAQLATARAEAAVLRAALEKVVAIADRRTVEFDEAHAALSAPDAAAYAEYVRRLEACADVLKSYSGGFSRDLARWLDDRRAALAALDKGARDG